VIDWLKLGTLSKIYIAFEHGGWTLPHLIVPQWNWSLPMGPVCSMARVLLVILYYNKINSKVVKSRDGLEGTLPTWKKNAKFSVLQKKN
jgi:hypothetical protein